MDTRKVTLIATIAVIALVAVGIGFAYTAATTNSGNDVTPGYMETTLRASADNLTPAYTDVFDGNVKYNTVTTYETAVEWLTFTFDTSQLNVDTNADSVNDAVKVGAGVYLNIDYKGGVAEAFKVAFNFDSGLISPLYTYKIGYKFGPDTEHLSAEQFVPFEPASGAILSNAGTAFTGGTTASGVKVILINIYVQGMTGEQKYTRATAESSLVKPFTGAKFEFKAISETTITAEKYSITYPTEPAHGTVTVSAATNLSLGASTTIGIDPDDGCHVASFTLNGIDYMSRLNPAAGGTITINVTQDVTVVATFAENE